MNVEKLTQEEIDFLYWFYINSDFGPAEGDVHYYLEERYEEETKKEVPKTLSWRNNE